MKYGFGSLAFQNLPSILIALPLLSLRLTTLYSVSRATIPNSSIVFSSPSSFKPLRLRSNQTRSKFFHTPSLGVILPLGGPVITQFPLASLSTCPSSQFLRARKPLRSCP